MLNLDVLPKNLNEALNILDGLEERDKNDLKASGPVSVHFTLGRWIRNYWNLWEPNSFLVEWFRERGIQHADDMSAIILEAFVARLKNETYDMTKSIEGFREHWRKMGLDPDNMI